MTPRVSAVTSLPAAAEKISNLFSKTAIAGHGALIEISTIVLV
jgi:hypothetical protein